MLNFNQLRVQIHDQSKNTAQDTKTKLKLGLTYKLEHAANRINIEKQINEIQNMLALCELTKQKEHTDVPNPESVAKIKEIACAVLEALSFEFKLFQELTSEPSQDLWKLIAYHSRITRTFEQQTLTTQVRNKFDKV
jgi:hypothetical protein